MSFREARWRPPTQACDGSRGDLGGPLATALGLGSWFPDYEPGLLVGSQFGLTIYLQQKQCTTGTKGLLLRLPPISEVLYREASCFATL